MTNSRNDIPDAADYELQKVPAYPPVTQLPRKPPYRWLALSAVIIAAGVVLYVAFRPKEAPVAPPPAHDVAEAQAPVLPALGRPTAPMTLPPLDESDQLVRELVKQISSHPRVMAWLTTRGLIRNFVVAVSMIAEGRTPAGRLQVLRPQSRFQVATRGDTQFIDPRSYDRYDGLAAATESIDPDDASQLYGTLKPRIEEAYRDLGGSDTSFDSALERAIVILLNTPVIDDPIAIVPMGGTGFRFARSDVEGLPAAQKQLLRMGTRNVRSIQTSVRRLATALGMPAARLPR